jgi:hypothetical protein
MKDLYEDIDQFLTGYVCLTMEKNNFGDILKGVIRMMLSTVGRLERKKFLNIIFK